MTLTASMRRGLAAAAWLALAGAATAAAADVDVLDRPARTSALAATRPITALAHAGHRIVAVGQRGHVLLSDDGGRHWRQAAVPVASDLTSVTFPDATIGIAVGHDGVVLRSVDGGEHWSRVLDGRRANEIVLKAMQGKVAAGGTDADRQLLQEAQRNVELGPDKPFLDAWFADAREGFVVGAYNLLLHTSDGGQTWDSWFDRADNPKLLNLYAIRRVGDALFVVGEGGLLLEREPGGERFHAVDGGYKGSFFGVIALPPAHGAPAGVLAFGMRGHALASRDGGQHWRDAATGLAGSITGGDVGDDGSVVLVDQAGNLAASRDGGETFSRINPPTPSPLSAVAVTPAGVVLAGPRGLRVLDGPLAASGSR